MQIKKTPSALFALFLLCSSVLHGQQVHSVYPGQVLQLNAWKLTLPVNTVHNGNPDEIKQPELNRYTDTNYFFVNGKKDGVIFRANAGGETTAGSNFARSELREMEPDGRTPAAWSSSTGKHTLFIDQRINHLPEVRKHVVVGQIHDDQKFVVFFRLENKTLLVSVNGGERVIIDPDYHTGTRFTVKLEVENNQTRCFYNDVLKYTFNRTFNSAYFKAGAYIQSSCRGKKKVEGESCAAYAEVEIFSLRVSHTY